MGHYHCEIVMPPTDNVEAAVEKAMAQFDENGRDEHGNENHCGFWDFWVIGGRWAGAKALARFDKERMDQFNAWMQETKVMVKGIRMGKQELADSETVHRVDAKWNEMFPEHLGPCPLFKHSNDQYDSGSTIAGDICKLGDVPSGLDCSRVIFLRADGEPEFMLSDSSWNGVSWEDHKWRGSFAEAADEYRKRFASYKAEWRAANQATDEWLVVTVDYHS